MKVLIVIDMQNDFITGSLGTEEAQSIMENVKKKIRSYQNIGDAIFFTRDTHDKGYMYTLEGHYLPVKHCISGSDGWNIADGLEVPNCQYVNKQTFGYPYWYDLLRGPIKQIELIGVCTDICVISNALILKANYPRIPIYVDASCCAGTTPDAHKAALQVMKSCQIEIINGGE